MLQANRYLSALLSRPPGPRPRDGYSFWQRYWAALTGAALTPRHPVAARARRRLRPGLARPHSPDGSTRDDPPVAPGRQSRVYRQMLIAAIIAAFLPVIFVGSAFINNSVNKGPGKAGPKPSGVTTRPTKPAATEYHTTTSSNPASTAFESPPPRTTYKPPGPQKITSYSGAVAQGCAAYGSVGSASGGSAVSFSFVNNSDAPIQIWYLTPSGNPVPEHTVDTRRSYSPSASVGQGWLIASSQGACLGVFEVTGSGKVIVT